LGVPNRTLRRARVGLAACALVAAVSCGREVTSPDGGRFVARGVSFVSEFPGGAAARLIGELVPFTRVRLVLRNLAGDVVVNRVIEFPSTATEVPVSLTVPLATASPEVMTLTLAYVNAAGDTVFRAGPDSVTLTPSRSGSQPPPAIVVEPVYTGPGAEATSVAIEPAADTVVSGDAFAFTATAFDGQMNPVTSAPIGWQSLTPSLATITAVGAGTGVTLAGRGTAQIVAVLANGAADTVSLVVQPKAALVELAAGNNQSANAGSALPSPVSVRVRATDNLPMAGVGVAFAAGNGGSVAQAAVVTDVNGIAATTWTLGTAAGAQSLTATVAGLTGSPVTFTATALSVGPVLLHHFPFTSGIVDIAGSAPGALQGGALVANGILKLNGGSDALQFSAPLVPTAGPWTISFFVRSRTPVANAAAYLSQGVVGGPALVVGPAAGGAFRYLDTQATATQVPAPDSLFQHIVIVADSAANATTVYRNGSAWITGLPYVPMPAGGNALRLGQGLAGGEAFAGDLDELRIYRGVLPNETITTLWELGPELNPQSRVVFTTQPPATVVSGSVLPQVCVEVQDFVGRPRVTYGATLGIAIGNESGNAVLGGTTSVAASAGQACFDAVTVGGVASGARLWVSGPNAIATASTAFDVLPGAATQLTLTTASAATIAGTPFVPPFAVTALDAGLNPTADFTGDVTVSIVDGPPGGTLLGTTTVTAVTGVATFTDLSMDLPGQYQLAFTSPGLASAFSGTITVSAPAATQLAFAQQPAGGSVNAAVAPPVVVEVRTATNALATGFNGPVIIALGANPGSATLGGTLTVNAVNGVATFSDLSLNVAANGYTLVASASGLTGATSAAFDIVTAAVTNAWINASGGTWSTAANWSQGRAPIATDTVAIDLAGTYTVTLDQNFTGALILLGGASGTQTLQATTRTLTTSLGLRIAPNGVYRQQGGTVGGTGQVRVQGRYETVTSAAIAPVLYVDTTGTLRVEASALGGSTTLTTGAGLVNAGTIELEALNAGYTVTLTVNGGPLENAAGGTIRSLQGAGGSRVLTAQLDNHGTLDLRRDLTLGGASRQHVNHGTIPLDSANLTVQLSGTAPSFTNHGAIAIGPGRTLAVSGGLLDVDEGTVTGYGGLLSTNNVTLAMTPASVRTVHLLGASTTLVGPYTVPAGDSLLIRGGTLAGPSLTVDGRLTVSGATTFTVPLAVSAGGHLLLRASGVVGGFTASVPGGFTNAGLVELTTADAGYSVILNVAGGVLDNAGTGVIRSSVGAGGGRTLRATLDNSGTLDLLHPLTIDGASAAHVNRAALTLGANLTVTQSGTTPSFTNLSTITLPAGRTLTVTGGALDLSGGTLLGDSATLATNNVLVTMTPASVRTRHAFGTLTTLSAAYTVPAGDSLRILSGSLAGPGLTVAGRVTTQGNSTLALPVTMLASGVLEARSTSFAGGHTFTVTDGFANAGTIELVSYNAGYATTFAITNGTLLNTATGVIRTIAGAGGSRVLAAQLENDGALDLGTQLNLTKPNAAHVNRGTIPLTTAGFVVTQSGTPASFTNQGSITIAAGQTMSVAGGSLSLGGGSLVGPDGTLALSNVSLDMTPASARTRFNFGVGSGFAAPYTVPAGDSLRLLGGTVGGAGLTVAGRVIALGSTAIAAPVTTEPTGVLEARSSSIAGGITFTVANGFTNTGTIELVAYDAGYATAFTVTNGTLVNAAGGVIRPLVGAGGVRTLGAELDNSGTLDLQQPLTLARADAAHVHRSAATLTADLTVTQTGTSPSFTNLGSITMPTGRTLTVTGGALNLSGGTLQGDSATLAMTNVALTMDAASARTRFRFNTGTAFTAPFTIPAGDSLRVLGGNIGGPGLIVLGRFISFGNATINAPLTTDPAGVIEARSTSIAGGHTLAVSSGFTNLGTIELAAYNSGYTTTFDVVTGTLVNAPGGVIRSVVGAGGGRTLAAQLDNIGTLDLAHPLTLAKPNAAHVHRSTLDLTAANLAVTQSGAAPSFTNLGSITLAPSRTLSVTGGALNLADGTLVGEAATLSMQNVALSMTPASARTRFHFNTGTSFVAPYIVPENDSMIVVGGTIGGPELTLDGQLVTLAATTIAAPFAITTTGELTVRSTSFAGGHTTTVSNGFTNFGAIELVAENAGYVSQLAVTTGTLVNASTGTIRTLPGSGGGTRTITAQVDNQGLLLVESPLTLNRAGAAHVNSGSIDIQTANLTVTQSGTSPSFTNTGSITLVAGRTLSVSGGVLDLSGGILAGDSATLATNNVTLAMTPASARTRFDFGTTTTLASAFTVPELDSLRIVGGTLAGPSLTVAGRVTALGNSTLNLPVVTETTGVLEARGNPSVGGVTMTVTDGFTNNGLIDIVSTGSGYTTSVVVTNGVLVNGASGTIRSSVGAGGARNLNAALDNSGALDILQPLTLSRTGAAHVNRAAVTLASSDLSVSQTAAGSFTNLGSVTLGAGRTLSVSGGTADLTGGSISGLGGTLQLASGSTTTLLMTAPAQAQARLHFGSAQTQLSTPLAVPAGDSLVVVGGSLGGTGTVAVDGVLHVRGSTTISAPIALDSLGLLRVVANNVAGGVTLTTPNGWTNAGTIELTSEGGSSWTAGLAVTNGTLVNAPGATVRSAVGTGGGRALTAQLQNAGTLDVQQGLTVNRASSVHVNTGSILVAPAGLLTITQSGTTPSFTNAGSIALGGSGTRLSVGSGQFVNTTGSLTGTGSLAFTGTVAADLAMPALDVPVNFGSGTTLASALTIPLGDTLTLTGGTIAGPGLVVNGTLLTTAASTISAPISTGPSSLVEVRTNALTTPQSWTVNGVLRLAAPTTGFIPSLTMSGQTLTVAAGGSFESPLGVGTSRTIVLATLDNFGTVGVSANVNLGTAVLQQRGALAIGAGQTLTTGTLNLYSGSSTTFNGNLSATTCSNLGGSVSGSNVPASCNP
jgi:hypothetical protein